MAKGERINPPSPQPFPIKGEEVGCSPQPLYAFDISKHLPG